MLGMDLFRVYTHASRARASPGGGAVRARSRVFSCAVSVCRPTDEMRLAVRPTLHRDAGPPPVPRSVALSCAR